jgi:hypothetical protein
MGEALCIGQGLLLVAGRSFAAGRVTGRSRDRDGGQWVSTSTESLAGGNVSCDETLGVGKSVSVAAIWSWRRACELRRVVTNQKT